MLEENVVDGDGTVITVVRGSLPSTGFPVSLPSLESPSSNSSRQNITEEEGQMDVQNHGKADNHFSIARRHQDSKHSKDSSLSSNAPSNVSSAGSIASAGLVVWDIFRETLGRPRRHQSKDKGNHIHLEDGKRPISVNSSNSTEREAAAIAVLENVLDNFNSVSKSKNSESCLNSVQGSHKVILVATSVGISVRRFFSFLRTLVFRKKSK